MAAGSADTDAGRSRGSGQGTPHAGVTLDVGAIDHASLHDAEHTHVHVEPIPWKTGAVGAVKPIDRETTWTPASPVAALPRPSEGSPKKKDAAVMAAAERMMKGVEAR